MLKVLQNKAIVTLIVIVILMLVFSVDSVPVSIMEARNFISAREMIVDGNWIMTTMNGEARYEKPPLPTWMTALSGLVFGLDSLVALRFPAIIFVALIGVFTYLLSKKILNDTTNSFINALIVITSFYVVAIFLEAPWDIFAHGFMLMAIYHLFLLFEKEKLYGKHIVLTGVFIGCSILCKGPIAIYAMLLPYILAYGFAYKFKDFKSKLIPFLGAVILALIIGGSWYAFVRINDPITFEAMAMNETDNWNSYNRRPFYYYWSFITLSGIWTIPALIGLIYPYLKSRVSNLKAYQFSLLWTILAVILLSLIPEKKSRYLMPVLIPLAINTGFYFEYLFRKFKEIKDKKEIIPVYFNFGLIALMAIAAPVVLYKVVDEKLSGNWLLYSVMTVISFGLGLWIIINLKNKKLEQVFLSSTSFFISLFMLALPLLKPILNYSNKSITKLDAKNIPVYGFNYISPEIIWHYGDKIPPIKLEDGTFDFPVEEQFGMLANFLSLEDWAILKTYYDIQKTDSFDLNSCPVDSKRHNERLVTDYYVLKKH